MHHSYPVQRMHMVEKVSDADGMGTPEAMDLYLFDFMRKTCIK